MKESLELIKRGIDELLTEDDLVSKLESKKQLTVKAVSYTHLTLPTSDLV